MKTAVSGKVPAPKSIDRQLKYSVYFPCKTLTLRETYTEDNKKMFVS